ncbi:MAG: aldehyde-activating protein [Azospirillum sp.]|nr:aldehyde-activating protein [Azospirillum sp.]
MTEGFSGGCLCGGVRFHSAAAPQMAGHCHCIDCRKSSGTGHCTHLIIPENAFTIEGEVRFYTRPANSGNLISRGFCPTCGAAIYSRNAAMPGMVFPRASALDDPEIVHPQMVVFASRAPTWDVIDPSLPRFAEMPDGVPPKVEAGRPTE